VPVRSARQAHLEPRLPAPWVRVRHPDGTVETVYGPDAFGLAEDAREDFAA